MRESNRIHLKLAALTTWTLALAACSKAPEAPPQAEAPVHNVVTDYVEQRVTAKGNAARIAERANDIIKKQEAQAEAAGNP